MDNMKRKAQVWSLDVIIGVSIFLAALVLFYVYAINFSDSNRETLIELKNDGVYVSSNILSQGSPQNWNLTNVDVPGISMKNRINQSQLDLFYQLTLQDYNQTKRLLNTRFDMYFFFTNPLIANGTLIDGIGKPGLNRTTIFTQENPKRILKVNRYVIYKNDATIMTVYLWEK